MAHWSQRERDLAGEAIYRFVFRSLYRLRAFNDDPHPGNYPFRPGGRVTFLDFGLVKRFRSADIAQSRRMIDAMVTRRDTALFRSVIEEIGLLSPDAPIDNAKVEEYFTHFYTGLLDDDPVTITPEWSSATARRFFDVSGPYGEVAKWANLPPGFVVVQRINLGLFAILGELGATANWRRIAEEVWPWIDGPPSTPLGEEEAAWHVRVNDEPTRAPVEG